jgi:hypothetical protein
MTLLLIAAYVASALTDPLLSYAVVVSGQCVLCPFFVFYV